MWIPIYLDKDGKKTTSELTRDYARVSRYLQNVSTAVGDLVLVINALATISGRTRRVSELLETVEVSSNPTELDCIHELKEELLTFFIML